MTREAATCEEARFELGVYALGASDPADRSAASAHLESCARCRDEFAVLAGPAALLSRVPLEEALALSDQHSAGAAPPAPLNGALRAAAARTRRRRWTLTAAAVLVPAAAAAVALAATASPAPVPASQAAGGWLQAGATAGRTSVTVTYRAQGWGTQVSAVVTGIPPGTRCALEVTGPGGQRAAAAGWTTDADEGRVSYPGSSAVPTGQVQAFVLDVAGQPSITVPVRA